MRRSRRDCVAYSMASKAVRPYRIHIGFPNLFMAVPSLKLIQTHGLKAEAKNGYAIKRQGKG